MNQSRKEYDKIKSEFKRKIAQACKEKHLKFKFLSSPIKKAKKNILYTFICEYGVNHKDKKWWNHYDFIIYYDEKWKLGIMSDISNMKLFIEDLINFDDNSHCGICYENNKYIIKCSKCCFSICEDCEKQINKCPQCRYSFYEVKIVNYDNDENSVQELIAMEHVNYLNAMLA